MSENDDPQYAPEPTDAQAGADEVPEVEDAQPAAHAPEAGEVAEVEVEEITEVAAVTEIVPTREAVAEPEPATDAEPAAEPTMVVPQLRPQAETTVPVEAAATQVVPQQAAAPAPQVGVPQVDAPQVGGPDASGAYPNQPPAAAQYPQQGQIPQQAQFPQQGQQFPQQAQNPQQAAGIPGQYPPPPYQGASPYQTQFQQYPPQPPAPARRSGPPPLTGFDFLASAYDAVRALAVGFVSVLVALLLVVYAGIANAHVPASYAYKLSAWLLGASLGAPITGSGSLSTDDSEGLGLDASLNITLRITVWALTIVVLFLIYVLARRRERQLPSQNLAQLFLRSALTGLGVSLILMILALTSQVDNAFESNAIRSDLGFGAMSGSIGLSPGFVFLGPLLLTLAVGLLGRFGVWLHAETTSDARADRVKAAITLWRPAVRTAWQQMSVMGTLIAVGLWIWLAIEAFSDPSTGPYRTALLLGLLVLLPNLAVYGSFIGMGVTLFVGGGVGASVLGQSTGDTFDGSPTSGSTGLGIFQGVHPWGVWLLLGGVIVGTLAPAVLARTTRRFAVNRDEYAPNGAWRSIVVGLVAALVVVLLGALSVNFSGNAGGLGGMNVTVSLGPSLLGALGLSALWFLLAYVALSLSLGHRFQPATPRPPAGIPPQGTPEYAQYQQYLAQQQQYQQQYPQQFAQPQLQQPQPPQQQYAQMQQQAPWGQTEQTEQLGHSGQTEQLGQTGQTEQLGQTGQSGQGPTVPLPQEGSGTHELPPDSSQTPQFPPPGQADPAQSYAQQYPQQYAQPYPQQQYPAQWATPGQPTGQWAQQPGVPGQPGLRNRLQRKIVVPLVLVVLAGGGFLAYHFIAGGSENGPGGAVTSYFNDLAAGDAKDAEALAVNTVTDLKVIDSAATLADASNRPSNFSVVSTRKPTAEEQQQFASAKIPGSNLTVVIVKYTVHGKQLDDLYLAVQNAQGKWVLPNPYLYVDVQGGWSSTATVDGVSFTAQDGVLVFPGAHVIAEPKNPDFAAESTTIVPQDHTEDGETYAVYGDGDEQNVTLPDPSLSSAGQAAVQKAYSDALDDCATQAETGEGDCGIDNYYDYYLCNNVTWTITTVGTVDVDLSSSESDGSFDWTADGTVASESGDYTDYFDDDQTFSDQPTDLEDDGTVVFNADGTATVTISE
ncbi:hypothetical protein [Actinospica robiniae]|uniref:hypothetical protein n=1 Tax=Actinospica robiniae TaxID=304901 RepID=UPI00040EF7AA|nr:hypothetical protein [Actinospica robiniae]